MMLLILELASLLKKSDYTVVFTGAGISAESRIPPFRGDGGFWEKHNPRCMELNYFYENPAKSWEILNEIYEVVNQAKPNRSHQILAQLENEGYIDSIITQNIDGLHQAAGSNIVHEFHGTLNKLECLNCQLHIKTRPRYNNFTCPRCGTPLKPSIVFFGEPIPQPTHFLSFEEAKKCDLMLIIGTSGEVSPANKIPGVAKAEGATIAEINIGEPGYSDLNYLFIREHSSVVMESLYQKLKENNNERD